jgi:hypothetical protein
MKSICGYCFIFNFSQNPNFSEYDFTLKDPKEESYQKYYSTQDDNICNCDCKLSQSTIPIQAFLLYYQSIHALKEGKQFVRLYFLENNINLLTVSKKIFSVFAAIFKDIGNYAEGLLEDSQGDQFMVEDQDLLKTYCSIFSIMTREQSFQYLRILDVFDFLNLDDKVRIMKAKIDQFSLKNFDQDGGNKDDK